MSSRSLSRFHNLCRGVGACGSGSHAIYRRGYGQRGGRPNGRQVGWGHGRHFPAKAGHGVEHVAGQAGQRSRHEGNSGLYDRVLGFHYHVMGVERGSPRRGRSYYRGRATRSARGGRLIIYIFYLFRFSNSRVLSRGGASAHSRLCVSGIGRVNGHHNGVRPYRRVGSTREVTLNRNNRTHHPWGLVRRRKGPFSRCHFRFTRQSSGSTVDPFRVPILLPISVYPRSGGGHFRVPNGRDNGYHPYRPGFQG